jgi:hypothetical protein
VDACDNTLPMFLRRWIESFFQFVSIIILIISVIPIFAAVILPLALIFFVMQTIYVNTSRQVR